MPHYRSGLIACYRLVSTHVSLKHTFGPFLRSFAASRFVLLQNFLRDLRDTMLSSCNSLSSMLYLLFLLCPLASAQDAIKLVFPPKNGNGDRTFLAADAVPLQWTCTFPMFTLQIWQGPDNDGTKAFSNLLSMAHCTNGIVIANEWLSERHRHKRTKPTVVCYYNSWLHR